MGGRFAVPLIGLLAVGEPDLTLTRLLLACPSGMGAATLAVVRDGFCSRRRLLELFRKFNGENAEPSARTSRRIGMLAPSRPLAPTFASRDLGVWPATLGKGDGADGVLG